MGGYNTVDLPVSGNLDAGQPIGTTGAVDDVSGAAPVALAGLADLSAYIAANAEAAACMSRHWTMYACGTVRFSQDGCTYADVAKQAAASQYNLQAMLVGLTQVASFTQRVADD